MKHVANNITKVRIVLSLLLFIIEPFSILFFTFYSICGITDILDGYIARKTNTASTKGARLDSIADSIFILVILIKLLPVVEVSKPIIIWITFIAAIRILAVLIAKYKYHTFASLHTYANKITGLVVFCVPLAMQFIDTNRLLWIVCFIASCSAIEELMIQITSKELHLNTKGIVYEILNFF